MKMTLAFENVTKEFIQGDHSIRVMDDITCSFEQGVSYVLTGISGCGKSTFLAILAGFEKPTSGHVLFNGHKIEHLKETELRAKWLYDIGFLFQSSFLSKELTVLENVILKGLIAGQSVSECKKRGYELLEQIGLFDKAAQFPTVLSGGEQQRVALARALFLKPSFLLADEPTAHLDEKTKIPLINLLQIYQKEYGMGLLMSSHDNDFVRQIDHIYTLHTGILQQKFFS
jgi:ABC-type lipoprotein export system ATPase subunit